MTINANGTTQPKKKNCNFSRLKASFLKKENIHSQTDYDNKSKCVLVSLLNIKPEKIDVSCKSPSVKLEKPLIKPEKLLIDYKPQNSSQANAKNIVENWRPGDKGFMLQGNCGSGKTHLLKSLLGRLNQSPSESKKVSLYFKACDLIDDLKDRESYGWTRIGPTKELIKAEATMFNVLHCDYLFIEDLGSENKTEFSKSKLFQILDHRNGKNLATFIDTNLSTEDMSVYNQRLLDRLETMCPKVHCIAEESYRRKT